MLKRLAALAIVAVLAACTAPAPADQPASTAPTSATFVGIDGRPLVANGVLDNAVQQELTANPAACAKSGGDIRPVCRMQQPMCVITFADAGKACSDGSDCGSGRCKAEKGDGLPVGQPAKGQCARTNDPCGCYQRIEDGVAQPTLCAD